MKSFPATVWWKVARVTTFTLVGVALLFTLLQGWSELRRQEVEWGALRWGWVVPAILLSFAGTIPSWLYWHGLLHRFGLPIALRHSFRAFYLSQLGKYVPGKVMVLAIRATIARGVATKNVAPSGQGIPVWLMVSAAAVVETLMYLAVGGAIGVVCGAVFLSDQVWVLLLSILMALGILVSMLPPVLKFWLVHLPLMKSSDDRRWLATHWSWPLFFSGLINFTIAWFVMGGGLLALTHVLPDGGGDWQDLPRLVSGVALSTVVGFVSFIPGGLGVREVVLFPIMGDRFPAVLVLVLMHRLVLLAAEALAAAIGYGLKGTVQTD